MRQHGCFLDRVCVKVEAYEDRMEVTSPSMMYDGLTIQQIKEGGSKFAIDELLNPQSYSR